jgi:translocation and assembly module TamB
LQGRYDYYGKEFVIESGVIQFTGSPKINPLINVVASYRSDPTVVYLDVTGTMKEPILKLRSTPPLPEQDIISVLIFGRPLNQLSPGAGGQSTNQEMTGLAGTVLGNYLTRSLRRTGIEQLNLDVFTIAPTEQGNRVTVGRYITRNLFVSYGHTISETGEKGLTADYYLGRHWVLEGEAGSLGSSHADILFRYPLNASSAGSFSPVGNNPFRNTLDRPDLFPLALP